MRRNTLSSLRFALVSSEQGEFCGRLPCGKRRAYNACSSRAIEFALGQKTARAMRRFRVRKWSTPHRGVDKKALAHPLPAKLLLRKIFAGSL